MRLSVLHEAILVPYACALAPVGVAVGVVVLWSPSDFVGVAAVSVLFLASFATLFLWLGMVEEERKALGRILRRARDEDEQAHSPTLEILGPDGVVGDVRGG